MYLHLGGDILVDKDKIVAIIDLETTKKGQINDKFIEKIKRENTVCYISEIGKEKTLIITTESHYLSPISSTTLLKRSILNLDEE
jgi:hypothetical protein